MVQIDRSTILLFNELIKSRNLDFYHFLDKTEKLIKQKKVELALMANKKLKEIAIARNLDSRRSIILILVSLVPESNEIIWEVLERRSNAIDYEIQFTLFCFLDKIFNFAEGQKSSSIILDFVEGYMMAVKKETAKAAWMAGDLLGDHWPLRESLPRLMRIATQAKYSAGRNGAIHGLEHALYNTKEKTKKRIIDLLKQRSLSEKSEKIRFYCSQIIADAGGE